MVLRRTGGLKVSDVSVTKMNRVPVTNGTCDMVFWAGNLNSVVLSRFFCLSSSMFHRAA